MRWAVVVMFGLWGTCAQAEQPRIYQSEAGDQFVMTCNASGYVLTHLGNGVQVYMGRSCDAFSEPLGGGTWCTSNGGFGVQVGRLALGFSRQEPYCPGVGYSPYFCSCGG